MSPRRVLLPASYLCALALPFCRSLAAQDDGGLQARQLYYKPKSDDSASNPTNTKKTAPHHATAKTKKSTSETAPDKTTTSADTPLGLKFSIVQADGSGNYVEVDPSKEFATGDAIRLRLEVNSGAYVYLLSRGPSGDGNFLFPEAGEENCLKPFQPIQVPAGGEPIHFVEPSGTEVLYILVSRQPIDDLQRLIPAHGPAPKTSGSSGRLAAANVSSAEMGDLMGRADVQSRDLVRGAVHPMPDPTSGGPNEHAVYAVNVSNTPGAQVIQKLELKHK